MAAIDPYGLLARGMSDLTSEMRDLRKEMGGLREDIAEVREVQARMLGAAEGGEKVAIHVNQHDERVDRRRSMSLTRLAVFATAMGTVATFMGAFETFFHH